MVWCRFTMRVLVEVFMSGALLEAQSWLTVVKPSRLGLGLDYLLAQKRPFRLLGIVSSWGSFSYRALFSERMR